MSEGKYGLRFKSLIQSLGNNSGDFFTHLASNGIEVCTFDQRGWGQSVQAPKEKGRSGGTQRVMQDITGFIKTQLPSTVPLFLMGHSMGGGETLTYAAIGPSDVRSQLRGYIASAPLIQVAPRTKPWKITEMAGRLAVKVLPNMQMVQEVDAGLLTHNEKVNDEYRADDLCHNTGTLEGLEGMLDRGNNLHKGKVFPKEDVKPAGEQGLYVLSGSGDDVVDPQAIRDFVAKLDWKDQKFTEYEGWYHVLHRESIEDAARMPKEVTEWILARC